MKKPELLMPAGNAEILKIAYDFGADAVYIGGEAYGLRAKADNFSTEEIASCADYAHGRGKRLYVTANIFAHNGDLEGIRRYLQDLNPTGIDGLIISDAGVVALAKEYAPDIPIHLSTQANTTNYLSFRFWWEQGIRRVVAARELSLRELAEIRSRIPAEMEIECFVHGAMCISYSGRCLLSNYFTGRDANRGLCTHPCRWKYTLNEETRPGEYLPVFENERGTYIFNSKDLCMIGHIPELLEAGIDSFKVEGRMKTGLYAATVARAYRRAIDDYFTDPAQYRDNMPWYLSEIEKCTNRRFTTGFYFGKPDEKDQIYGSSTYHTESIYLGVAEAVDAFGRIRLTQRNKFSVGDAIEIMSPNGVDRQAKVEGIFSASGEAQESAPHAKQTVFAALSEDCQPGDVLRKPVKTEEMT